MTVNSGDVSPSSSHSESNGHRNSRTRRKSISPRLKTDRPHASHHVERSKVYKSPLSDEDDENRHRTGREWDEARRRSRSPKHLSERPERSRHDDRARIGKMGVRSVWAHSPSMRDIHDIYADKKYREASVVAKSKSSKDTLHSSIASSSVSLERRTTTTYELWTEVIVDIALDFGIFMNEKIAGGKLESEKKSGKSFPKSGS
ncbi:hypothetical protein AB6A40_004627 [Gnathostoma spinigerum]|uniref:Uncharacterized protein n=1 Tax=Gnathostoma spinigerum TaxID=75299 RepID=A0ABD6ED25_9BILA